MPSNSVPFEQGITSANRRRNARRSAAKDLTAKLPELVKVEVENLKGELVAVHDRPKDGSSLEAAAELHKLTEILNEKAEKLKELADQAFLGEAEIGIVACPASSEVPEVISAEGMHIHTAVKEAVEMLQEEIGQVEPHRKSGEAVGDADALDKVAAVLEDHSKKVEDKKIELAAKELNNLDGFDH